MDLVLRAATPADAEEVAGVYVASWNHGFGGLLPPRELDRDQVARWERDLQEGRVLWRLVEDEGSVVGFAGSGPSRDPVDPDLGELDTIAVLPRAWRRGVGRRLMSTAVQDLLEARYREAVLWTLAAHSQARAFYEATGWRVSGEVRDSGNQVAYRRFLAEGRST